MVQRDSNPILILNLGLLLMLAALPGAAAPDGSAHQVSITHALHDAESDELTIDGKNFGEDLDDQPVVTLGGLLLDPSSPWNDTLLVVNVAGFEPGVHALVVSDGRSPTRVARMDLTLGAVGPQGLPGEVGPQGAPGIRGETGVPGAQGPQWRPRHPGGRSVSRALKARRATGAPRASRATGATGATRATRAREVLEARRVPKAPLAIRPAAGSSATAAVSRTTVTGP